MFKRTALDLNQVIFSLKYNSHVITETFSDEMVSSLLGVCMALFTTITNLLIILGFGLATNLSEDSEDGDSIQEI